MLAPSLAGVMWLAKGSDLRRIHPDQPGTAEIVTRLPFGPSGVRVMREDSRGVLWLGTQRNGLFGVGGAFSNAIPLGTEPARFFKIKTP